MAIASKMIKELLENGVHFGHQTSKWNPKMGKFIFGKKSGIYIIDLEKTEKALMEASKFVEELAASGGKVLFAGTKKQAKQIIREEAQKCDMFFVEERWLGGCLTNFNTIRKSISRLDNLEDLKKSETYTSLAKKERVQLDREEQKLLKNLRGIRHMKGLPAAVIVVDAEAENIAVLEARKLKIPVIALLDTNCDPDLIDFPIPGNDDAIRAIRYVCSTLADAINKGQGKEVVALKEEEPVVAKEKGHPSASLRTGGSRVIPRLRSGQEGQEEPVAEEEPVVVKEKGQGSRVKGQEEPVAEEEKVKEPVIEKETVVEPKEEKEEEAIEGDINL